MYFTYDKKQTHFQSVQHDKFIKHIKKKIVLKMFI